MSIRKSVPKRRGPKKRGLQKPGPQESAPKKELRQTLNVDVTVAGAGWTREDRMIATLCRRVAEYTLIYVWPHLPRKHSLFQARDVEVSITLSTNARVKALNRDYRGKNKPTNVLSFPAVDASTPILSPLLLGDVILALETTREEAKAEGKRFRDHVAHLVVHGVLHLLGYDHEGDRDAARMEKMERLILADLGIADPYAETVPAAARARRR
jgi:probable rRNA maturation factor